MAAPPPPPADMLALQDQEDEDTELPSELFTDETAQQELYQACRTGDLAGVQAAIDAGASVRAILKGVKRDKTCLLVAVAKGHLEVVKLLLALGADVNAKAKGTLFNALHYACEKGHVDIVKFFHVEKGFSIEEKAVNDLLPIHLAVLQCKSSVLKYLVESGASINARTRFGSTPIYLSASNKDDACLTYLVEQGADVNLGNNDGSTPLHCLVRHGQIPLLRILVEQGKADIHQADLSGRTPLDDAAINMMSEAAAYLWEHGAEPSMKSEHKTAVVCCRPLSLNTPPARANAAVCGVGSKLYVFGGYGVPSEYIVDDPMNRLPEEIGCELLGDFTMIDLDDVEMGEIVPFSEKQPYRNLKLSSAKTHCGPYLLLHPDGLTAEANYPPEMAYASSHNDCIIKAEKPFTKEEGFGYFEVACIHPGTSRITTVGLTSEGYELDKQPGWIKDSYAIHGDDGNIFHNRGRGLAFAERMNEGDVIGVGINWVSGLVFYTKNGQYLGAPWRAPQSDAYWPTVGVANPLAKFKINFGAVPFRFNFQVPMVKWVTPVTTGTPPEKTLHPMLVHSKETNSLICVGNGINILNLETMEWTGLDPGSYRSLQYCGGGLLRSKPHLLVTYGLARIRVPNMATPLVLPIVCMYDLKEKKSIEILPPAKPGSEGYDDELHERGIRIFNELRQARIERMTLNGDDKMVLFGGNGKLFIVDPLTLEMEEVEIRGHGLDTMRPAICEINGDSALVFGGLYKGKQWAANEVSTITYKDGNVSKPQQLGYQVARPRDGAAPGFAFLTNPFYTGEYEEDRKAGAQPKVVEAVAHVFGTGTDNFVDDFDILLLEKGERPDELSQFYNKSGVDSLPDLQIKVRDQIFNVHKSILYCRSDYFRKEFESLPDKATSLSTLEITDSDSSLFGSMLELLYTDLVNVAAVGDKFREFAALLRKYAPNHVQRAVEHHLMTKVTTASTMAKDMKTLAHQQLFSDIVFKVGNEPVYAHKAVLCSRSPYFAAMLLGGLREASQKEIQLPEDVSKEPFLLVLEYLYTKDADAILNKIVDEDSEGSLIVEVFKLACQYNVRSLKKELEFIISFSIVADNVATLLILADQQSALILKAHCVSFVNAHKDEVFASEDYQDNKEVFDQILAAARK